MEPPFMTDDFEDVEDMEDLDDEAAANRRQFILLMSVFAALLAIAIVTLIFIIGTRNGAKSEIELTNEAVLATNTAVVRQQVALVTAEAATAAAAEQERAIALTNEAVSATDTAVAVAAASTVTAEAATAQARPTRTPTPVVASPTETPPVEGEGTPEGIEVTDQATAVAQVTGTRAPSAPTRTPVATRGTTPDTGVGGLGAVLVAAVLVVVLFAARRLRMAS